MSTTSMIIIGVILVLAIGGAFALYQYQKKNLEKLFTQVYETSKQVPKQKKNSFQLLMFKEAMSASLKKSKKAKKAPSANPLNNPKYIEIQMMHMSRILKDTSSVKDKKIKRALRLLKDYQTWETTKNAKNKQTSQSKVASKPKKDN